MTSPRKFSEKIALHNAKQAEETAAFEQVMRDVSTVKGAVNARPAAASALHGGGGSLPNVANVDRPKPTLNTPETTNTNGLGYQERGGGPIRSPKRIDTSPYSTGQYLPLPQDSVWRRTNSDSALHTSSQNPPSEGLRSPGSQRRVLDEFSQGSENDPRPKRHLSASPDGRPRSCHTGQRVPSINIYPTLQDTGAIQIPIGKNTGSLPDLTSFDIRAPLSSPLDEDSSSHCGTWGSQLTQCVDYDHHTRTQVPGSLELKSSPDSYGATNLSSLDLNVVPSSDSLPFPDDSPILTPLPQTSPLTPGTTSPAATRRLREMTYRAGHGHGHGPQVDFGNRPWSSSRHWVLPTIAPYPDKCLTVPTQLNSSYLHSCKGMIETTQRHQQHRPQSQAQAQPPHPVVQPSQTYPMCQPPGTQSPLHSPTYQNTHSALSPQDLNSLAYRSPQPDAPPSPQNSSSLPTQYRSTSSPNPSDPPSPKPPVSPTGEDNYYMNQASIRQESEKSLQHEFEQFSMMENTGPTNIDLTGSPTERPIFAQEDISHVTTNYYSTYGQQNQHVGGGVASGGSTQAPNTPSSIPDIVLTDFSTADMSLSRWGEVRQDLEPLDFDALQLLADPSANVSDPLTEEILRTDHS